MGVPARRSHWSAAIRIGEFGASGKNPTEMATSILIVDDHPSFRASARMLLECEGYDVVGEAEDGEAAIEAVGRLRPDVVLLDVHLPDIDGVEIARRLAATNGFSPAVVLTSSRDLAELGAIGGVRGFIPKSELSGAALEALL
jgi:DNA-binding NarL/FixJ family response regulator